MQNLEVHNNKIMEENQNPIQTVAQVQTPSVSQTQPVQQVVSPPNKSKRLIIEIIIFIALLGLLGYLLFANSQTVENQPTAPIFPPTRERFKSQEEQELEKIDVGSVDADLQDIEADLQKL